MTAINKLNKIITCLNKMKTYYALTQFCKPNIELNITHDSMFLEDTFKRLDTLYNTVCNAKSAFIQEQLVLKQESDDFDDFPDSEETIGNIPLLFKKHSFREACNIVSPGLNQAVANLYSFLTSICSQVKEKVLDLEYEILLDKIKIIADSLEELLINLSDHIEQLPFVVRSSAFSLGRYLEKLERNYEEYYKRIYLPSGMFSWFSFYYSFKIAFRNQDRTQEITFITQLSLHEKADDELRRAIIEVMNRKIIEKESINSANTSILKKLLDAGILRSVSSQNTKYFETVSTFCEKYSLEMPDHLNNYIRSKMISSKYPY